MRRQQTPWPRGRRPTTVTPVWLLFACGSALFAGLTAILAKQGVRTTDSTLATAEFSCPKELAGFCENVSDSP